MKKGKHYRRSLSTAFLTLFTALTFAACGSGGGDQLYYVALGNSLSVGFQPDAAGVGMETDQGYPDLIYAQLLQQFPNLQLIKLGCPGETTQSMISGGVCDDYASGSQLDDALEFLVENRKQTLLVTLDIGANDLFASDCLEAPPETQQACFEAAFRATGSNLSLISSGLFSASDGTFPVVAMNYYNPLLVSWIDPTTPPPLGPALAMATAALQEQFNTQVLGAVYGLNGFPVADVAAAFNSQDFTTQVPFSPPGPEGFTIPLNVATICQLTYMCVPPPQGPDIHANPTGYQLIAATFLEVIQPLLQ